MSTERAIDAIIILEGTYPRDGLDKATVEAYRAALAELPPIIITTGDVLVDGAHRLQAYRLEGETTIPVEVDSTLPEHPTVEQILIRAAELNARHGKQLTMTEKARVARTMYGKRVNGVVYRTSEIAAKLGADDRTVREWVRTQREEEQAERQRRALDLYLQCYTQEEIAERLGWSQQVISNDLAELTKNGNSAENGKPDPLRFADVWSFVECDRRFGHDYPGRIPGQIVQHVLYYYTNVFDVVVDPMAGSGTTVDVCRSMLRRYRAYDLKPVRADIKKHDIKAGLPDETKGCNLIFVDPPYGDMNEADYRHPEGSLAS
ncbi:MAG: DNA methyltransferase, partial [Chloroflexota bacterium]|nr:DNA methyltransferase [Chloroflexota bacterium]